MSIAAGSLNQRISILHNVQSGRDSFGAQQTDWQVLITVWANVLFKNGSQMMNANREQSDLVASVRVRLNVDIKSDMRLQYREDVYDIHSILPSPDRSYMDIVIKTINPETEA